MLGRAALIAGKWGANRCACAAHSETAAKEKAVSKHEPERPVEIVDLGARTISYYVDAEQFCILQRDYKIQEPGQQEPLGWHARVHFSAGVSKADAVAALRSITEEIETSGLPATADAIIRVQSYLREAELLRATLPPALRAEADRMIKQLELCSMSDERVANRACEALLYEFRALRQK